MTVAPRSDWEVEPPPPTDEIERCLGCNYPMAVFGFNDEGIVLYCYNCLYTIVYKEDEV